MVSERDYSKDASEALHDYLKTRTSKIVMSETERMIKNLQITSEEQKMMRDIADKMEKELFQELRDAYSVIPASIVAKPLSKEDIENFRREWEKWQ